MNQEINTNPPVDGTYVETSFGRSDFHQTEDRTKRQYTDNNCAKARGLDSTKIREWAKTQNITIGQRGRFRIEVINAYQQAHPDTTR